MEVIIAGIVLIIVGTLVCCLDYRIENKIIEKSSVPKGKIVQFRAHKRKFRFMKKKNKIRKSKRTNQYSRRVNSY